VAELAQRAIERAAAREVAAAWARDNGPLCPGAAGAACGKIGSYVVDGKRGELWCLPHAPAGAVHAHHPCASDVVCAKRSTFVFDGEPGKRWCAKHAPPGTVFVVHPCAFGVACAKQGTFVFDGEPGKRWCAVHAPAAAHWYDEELNCTRCSRPSPGRSGVCGACRLRAARKARSVRAEEIALQVVRETYPAEDGWVLTHNRAGMGGQDDNLCTGAPGELADTRYRVDVILWHKDNPNMVTLWELDDHKRSSRAATSWRSRWSASRRWRRAWRRTSRRRRRPRRRRRRSRCGRAQRARERRLSPAPLD
jgi:hypothetical protein